MGTFMSVPLQASHVLEHHITLAALVERRLACLSDTRIAERGDTYARVGPRRRASRVSRRAHVHGGCIALVLHGALTCYMQLISILTMSSTTGQTLGTRM